MKNYIFKTSVDPASSTKHCVGYKSCYKSSLLFLDQHCTSSFHVQFGQDPNKTVDYFLVQSCLWTLQR